MAATASPTGFASCPGYNMDAAQCTTFIVSVAAMAVASLGLSAAVVAYFQYRMSKEANRIAEQANRIAEAMIQHAELYIETEDRTELPERDMPNTDVNKVYEVSLVNAGLAPASVLRMQLVPTDDQKYKTYDLVKTFEFGEIYAEFCGGVPDLDVVKTAFAGEHWVYVMPAGHRVQLIAVQSTYFMHGVVDRGVLTKFLESYSLVVDLEIRSPVGGKRRKEIVRLPLLGMPPETGWKETVDI